MSCDFKPGDEVVCVDASGNAPELTVGATYIVERVIPCGDYFPTRAGRCLNIAPGLGVWVFGGFDFFGQTDFPWPGYAPSRFRKVERCNDSLSIKAFLTIKPGYEEPRRAPAKKRERV